MLRDLPPVTPEHVDTLQSDLQRRAGDAELPALQKPTVQQLPRTTPRPCLTLSTNTEAPAASRDNACLRFEYHGLWVGPGDPSTRVEGNRVLKIRRDDTFEMHCIDRLHALGFESQHDTFTLTGAPQAWLEFLLHKVPELREHGWQAEAGSHEGQGAVMQDSVLPVNATTSTPRMSTRCEMKFSTGRFSTISTAPAGRDSGTAPRSWK